MYSAEAMCCISLGHCNLETSVCAYRRETWFIASMRLGRLLTSARIRIILHIHCSFETTDKKKTFHVSHGSLKLWKQVLASVDCWIYLSTKGRLCCVTQLVEAVYCFEHEILWVNVRLYEDAGIAVSELHPRGIVFAWFILRCFAYYHNHKKILWKQVHVPSWIIFDCCTIHTKKQKAENAVCSPTW